MSLLTKLRFKPSAPVFLLGDAEGVQSIAPEEGFSFQEKQPSKSGKTVQQVLLFARDAAAMRRDFPALVPHLADGAIVWIAYPKKSGSIQSDLTRDAGWKVVDEHGYIGVSQASINDDWSALWFKKPEEVRSLKRAVPLEDRVTEGIDYKARTVALPADAAQALDAVPGLRDFFDQFSFTHKREWAEAIADAKKPETRTRRILKMVEDLTKQQQQKASKTAAKSKA